MIISKKNFEREINKAVQNALFEERKRNNENIRDRNERDHLRRIEDNIYRDINDMRNDIFTATKEINNIISYLCDKDPEFAKNKLNEITGRRVKYGRKYNYLASDFMTYEPDSCCEEE